MPVWVPRRVPIRRWDQYSSGWQAVQSGQMSIWAAGTPAARLSQALRIVKSAAQALDSDPAQARRALVAQAVELRRVGEMVKEPRLMQAAEALMSCMQSDIAGPAARQELVKRIDALMGFMAPEDKVRAA